MQVALEQVSIDEYAHLLDLLHSVSASADTMLTSPSYFLLTGRRGMWIAYSGSNHMIVVAHPNVDGQLLLFPVGDRFDLDFTVSLAEMLKGKASEIVLSRISGCKAVEVRQCQSFEEIEENVLDWKFPAAILDNERVEAMGGSRFSGFRNKVSKIRKKEHRVFNQRDEEYRKRSPEIFQMIRNWAENVASRKSFDVEHLISSNKYGYEMGLKQVENFDAYVFECCGEIMALYTAETLPHSPTANGITLCIDRERRGSSEFAYYWTCKKHRESGFKYTNINGAETEELYKFRLEKLQPNAHISMCSFRFRS